MGSAVNSGNNPAVSTGDKLPAASWRTGGGVARRFLLTASLSRIQWGAKCFDALFTSPAGRGSFLRIQAMRWPPSTVTVKVWVLALLESRRGPIVQDGAK